MSKKKKRARLYDIVTGTKPQSQLDPLDQLMEDEARGLASEARRLRLEEIIETRKRKLSRTRQGSPIMGDDSNQLMNLMNLMNKQLETGVKIATSREGSGSNPAQVLEYVKLFNDIMRSQGAGPSFFEQFQQAREMGLINQSEGGDPNKFSVQMESLRSERMLTAKKIDLELMKMRLQQEDGQNKLALLAQIFAPVVAYSGNKMSEDMRARGADAASRIMNPEQNIFTDLMEQGGIINPGSLQGKTGKMLINCDCGFSESMLVPIPPPEQISCPNCGKKLLTGPQPGTGDEEDAEWKRPV
jgi:hypothetical protein